VKFNYTELSTVPHNNQRWYDTPFGYYPSITTVLGKTEAEEKKASLKKWQESLGAAKAAAVSHAATTRGTNVHLLIERYLKGEDVNQPIDGKSVPYADMQSFNSLKLKLSKIDEVWGQEVPLYCSTYEIGGRCDLVGVYKGRPAIIDFKTSNRVKNNTDIHDYKLQICFYAEAHNEMFDTQINSGVILMVAETGFPMEFLVEFNQELKQELKERAALFWQTAINRLE